MVQISPPMPLPLRKPPPPTMLMARPLQPAPSATQRAPLWHWLILLAALLVLGAQIGFDLFQSRQRIEVEAVNRLENHSLVLAEELERRLNSTNVALETLRGKAIATATSQTQQSSMAALTSDLEMLTHAIEGLRTLAVFDAAGNVVACTRPELIGRNFSQRDYFQVARQGGDARLDGRQSCGVGGHVDLIDAAPTAAQTLLSAAYRELVEELEIGADQLPPLMPCGLIYEGHSTIGRVHLGILMVATWPLAEPPKPRAGEALSSLGFFSPAEITGDPRFELWSRLAAGWVGEMLGGQ